MKDACAYFVELNHVGVTDFLQNVDLACHAFNVGLVLDLVFLQYLNGHLLVRDRVGADPHFSESALPERFA